MYQVYIPLIQPCMRMQEAVAKMKVSMVKLAELNKVVWEHGPWQPDALHSRPSGPKTP